jgi:RimJ/RimL family protein N-acetyltransferase
MLLTIFKQMIVLGRYPRTFVRVDRRNRRSLALCDRVGLTDEHPDPHSDLLVQRWGELPRGA